MLMGICAPCWAILFVNIPVVNELVLLLVYAETCFRTPKHFQRGQNHTRWVSLNRRVLTGLTFGCQGDI